MRIGRFGNRFKDSTLPDEVQQYYATTRREKANSVGLLALTTFASTLVLAAGLYFGGRFLYRMFDNDNDAKVATTQTVHTETTVTAGQVAKISDAQKTAKGTYAAQKRSRALAVKRQQVAAKKKQQQRRASAEAAARAGKVANAGPGDVVAIFVGTSLGATILHQIYIRRRAQTAAY